MGARLRGLSALLGGRGGAADSRRGAERLPRQRKTAPGKTEGRSTERDMKAHSADGQTSTAVTRLSSPPWQRWLQRRCSPRQINILLQPENTGAQLGDVGLRSFLRNEIKANQSLSEYPLKCLQSDGAWLHERGKQTREGHEGSL